jgi:hypothetical protein
MEINLHAQRNELRRAFINLVVGFSPNAFITLATNSTGSVEDLKHKLGKFCAMIDKALLGDNWYKLPHEKRTDGLFTIEHTASNIHAHGVLRLPEHEHDDVPLLVQQRWSRLSEAGNTDFQEIDDAAKLAAYCTKEMHRASFDTNQIVLTREFMKSR